MKKVRGLLSILMMVLMTASPLISFATEEGASDASGRDNGAISSDGLTEVTVAGSVEELAEESEAAYDNEAFFIIDASKDDSAELATDEVSDDVTDILSGGGSAAEKQDEIIGALEDSGLYRAEGSGKSKVEVTSRFAYQRLRLTAPQDTEINAYGATKAVYFEDSYLLSYDSMEAAMHAYDALTTEYGRDAVLIDSPMKLNSGESVKGWGTSYMGMGSRNTMADSSGLVTVAVIDTGIQKSHPVFSGKTILEGRDFVNSDDDPADDEGHGTAVSGIIAESTPSNVSIMPLKAMDKNGEGSLLDIVNAVRYADNNGADIINMSLGGYLDYEEDLEYCEELFSGCDALIVCAAGNENRDLDAPGVIEIPGELSSTVCVGSITAKKERSYFSNYGQAVDFAAPGSNVLAATRSGSYSSMSGTSFSSPYLAAAAAIVKVGHSEYSNGQIIGSLRDISEDLGAQGRDAYFGSGCPRFSDGTEPQNEESLPEPDVTAAIRDESSMTYNETADQKETSGSVPKKINPTVKLSKTWYTWNNKTQTPSVAVYDKGVRLPAEQYSVSYSKGRRNVGTYSVRVTLKGDYSGAKAVTYNILPKGTMITGLAGAKKAVKVRWARQSARMSTGSISGYQVQVSTDPKFRNNSRTATFKGYRNTYSSIRKLAPRKRYYIRIRTYRKIGKKHYFSVWSKVRTVRTR